MEFTIGKYEGPSALVFCSGDNKPVMTITKGKITVDPDVDVDVAARAVIAAIQGYIDDQIEKMRQEERK